MLVIKELGCIAPDSPQLRGVTSSRSRILKERYEAHVEQFDVIGEHVWAMDFDACGWGLKEALGDASSCRQPRWQVNAAHLSPESV